MKEQRLTNRFAIQRNVLCRCKGRSAMADVCDVSLTGLRMRGSANLEIGSQVVLKVLGPTSATQKEVRCHVQWQSIREDGQRESGLSFLVPISELVQSWIGEILRELENQAAQLLQRRRSIRASVRIPLTIQSGGDAPTYAEFVELSEGGAILRCGRTWKSGESMQIRANLAGRVFTLWAVVIRTQEVPMLGGNQADHSLRFDDLAEEAAHQITKVVASAVRRVESLAA